MQAEGSSMRRWEERQRGDEEVRRVDHRMADATRFEDNRRAGMGNRKPVPAPPPSKHLLGQKVRIDPYELAQREARRLAEQEHLQFLEIQVRIAN
jgi:hypothetical protein